MRLVVHSRDLKLQSLLAVTLGPDFEVTVEPDPVKVKALAAEERADVLIVDFDSKHYPLEKLRAFLSDLQQYELPTVAMTEDESRATAMQLVQHGVYDLFRKPPHLLELKLVVRRAYEHRQLKKELRATRAKLQDLSSCDQLLGSSGQMRVVYDLIRRVANLETYVLIHGESGTGKELVARAIHNLSDRAGEPFVPVSCGAIPETLVEAELFGHEKGAFTGAIGTREGLLEQAGGGTLFLDEIGELTLHTQVKLLRVLQEKEFCRVGGGKIIPLRARVLFATHRSLEEMVDAGTFRRDLFFRITVFKIQIPPLQERQEDIPALARHFLQQYNVVCHKSVQDIRSSAMQLLLDHHWPGNVRELENVMQRAVILCESNMIGPEDLPDTLHGVAPLRLDEPSTENMSFEEQLREYKVRLANKALVECNGNKTMAARKLSITRAYLHRLLRQAVDDEDVAVNQ